MKLYRGEREEKGRPLVRSSRHTEIHIILEYFSSPCELRVLHVLDMCVIFEWFFFLSILHSFLPPILPPSFFPSFPSSFLSFLLLFPVAKSDQNEEGSSQIYTSISSDVYANTLCCRAKKFRLRLMTTGWFAQSQCLSALIPSTFILLQPEVYLTHFCHDQDKISAEYKAKIFNPLQMWTLSFAPGT